MVNLDDLRKTLKNDIIKIDDNYDFFLTGNPMFDAFIGSGGIPKYQLEYIWATSSVGKSTFAIQMLASYIKQSDDYIALYFDTEESVTRMRLKQLGIDDDQKIIILNPNSIERAGEIILKVKESNPGIDLFIIWDTLQQTPSNEELDGYAKIGMQARAFTSLFRVTKFYDNRLTMFALNQHRESMESQYMPKEPPSCNAVKHKSFLTLYATRKKSKLIDPNFGFVSTVHTKKSKIISPHRKLEFEVTNTSGYDSVLTLINYLKSQKVIGSRTGWYFFADDKENKHRLKEFYQYLLTDECVPRWKFAIESIFTDFYPDDDAEFIEEAKARIYNYYFKNDKIQLSTFTSLSKAMRSADNVSVTNDVEDVINKVNQITN
jgi:RecA/RadA recombinase